MPKTSLKPFSSNTSKTNSTRVRKIDDVDAAFAKFVKDNKLPFSSTHDKGVAFEKFCLVLLQAEGYDIVKAQTASSGDKGIDLIVSKTRIKYSDSIWGDDEKEKTVFAVQCKYKNGVKVGTPIVRDLIGALDGLKRYKKKKAVLMTNSEYTVEALDLKKSTVILLDGSDLFKSYQKAVKKGLI